MNTLRFAQSHTRAKASMFPECQEEEEREEEEKEEEAQEEEHGTMEQ